MSMHITPWPCTSSSEYSSPSFPGSTCSVFESTLIGAPVNSSSSSTPSSTFPLHPLPPSILATLYPLLITDGMLEQAIEILRQQRRTREAVYEGWKSCAKSNGEIPQWILAPVKQAHQDFLTALDQEEARLLQLLLTRRIVAAMKSNPQIPPATTTCAPVYKPKRRRYRKRKTTSLVTPEKTPTKSRPSLLQFLEETTQVIMRLLGHSKATTEEFPHCINGDTPESFSCSTKEERTESEAVDVSQQDSPDSSLPTRLCTRDGTSVLAYCRVTCEHSGTVYFYHKVERESLHDLPEGEEANSEDELEYDRLQHDDHEALHSEESYDGHSKLVMKRKHESIAISDGESVDALMPPGHL